MFTFEPLDHGLVFLPRREAGPDWFPWPTGADAAGFHLGEENWFIIIFRHGLLLPKKKTARRFCPADP
jgi:hypothetical protein